MRSPLIPLLLGLVFISGAVGILWQQKQLQQADIRGIADLRAELDSVRAAAVAAASGPDSARLAQSVADRTYKLSRREFHVAPRQEVIDRWWRLTGIGTVLAAVGALFVVLAVFTRFRSSDKL